MLASCVLLLSLELVMVKILQPGFPQHNAFISSDLLRSDLVCPLLFLPILDLVRLSQNVEPGIQSVAS